MNKESVIIILPLPPVILSPNRPVGSFGGRIKKASIAKRCRNKAREVVESQNVDSKPWEVATVFAIFYHKTNRRRDDVNHLAMLKPYYDGIVDGGLLVDDNSDHLKTLTPDFKIDRTHPRVELEITNITEEK